MYIKLVTGSRGDLSSDYIEFIFYIFNVQQGLAVYSYAINHLGTILLGYRMDNFRKICLLPRAR